MKILKLIGWAVMLIAILSINKSQAQIKALSIGAQMPDLEYLNAYNFKTRQTEPVKFSQLKGKIVILDFWGTFCIPCIESFPKLDSLQKQYQDKIQIITVNTQSLDAISQFFNLHTVVYRPSLPFITDDKELSRLFPHTGVPFQVWIDKNGKVLHLAEAYNLTRANLDETIANKPVKMMLSSQNVYPKTLFNDKYKNLIMFSSYLSHDSYELGLHVENPDKGQAIVESGTPLELYRRAYYELTNHEYDFFSPGRTVLETKDSTKYFDKSHGDIHIQWANNNIYWYQLTTPESYRGNLYELMRQDLERYFHFAVNIQKRAVKCLVLVRSSNEDKLRTKGGAEKYNFNALDGRTQDTSSIRGITNMSYSVLSNRIKGFIENWNYPFQDATGYSGNVDFTVTNEVLSHLDLKSLKKQLYKYDLKLVEKECLLDVLVVKDYD
jgi:thiol-disulfide isomerase/thioredoxin